MNFSTQALLLNSFGWFALLYACYISIFGVISSLWEREWLSGILSLTVLGVVLPALLMFTPVGIDSLSRLYSESPLWERDLYYHIHHLDALLREAFVKG